ncbi:hypothetical protein D3C76_1469380 [compost metagenome]
MACGALRRLSVADQAAKTHLRPARNLLGHYSAGAKPPGQTCPQIPADGSQGVGEIRRGRVADPGDHADRIEL